MQDLGPHRLTVQGMDGDEPVGAPATHTWSLTEGWEQVSAGTDHTCGLRTDGSLHCWGDNTFGELGDASPEDRERPVLVFGPDADRWMQVSVGETHTCAIKTDETVWCWGRGSYTGLGGDDPSAQIREPKQLFDRDGAALTAASVHAGSVATCAIGERSWCWGSNGFRGLGQARQEDAAQPLPWELALGDSPVEVLSMGGFHACALAEGVLRCWGLGTSRQLGLAPELLEPCGEDRCSASPLVVDHPEGIHWADVAAGRYHTCAVDVEGGRHCWGHRRYGQFGDGSSGSPTVADLTSIDDGAGWRHVAAGGVGSCGIRDDGALWCWGDKTWGRDAEGVVESEYCETRPCRRHPTPMGSPETVWRQVTVGRLHTCGITADGRLHCWGATESDQQGDGLRASEASPVEIPGDWAGSTVRASALSTAAVDGAGRRWVWGGNRFGALGDGGNADRLAPRRVDDGPWREVFVNYRHGCGVDVEGVPWCWGTHAGKYFGAGDVHPAEPLTSDPVRAAQRRHLSSLRIAMDYYRGGHMCGLEGDGSLWCWGENHHGQLGDGEVGVSNVPVQEVSASAWSDVAVGSYTGVHYTCGIKVGGSLWCWGQSNSGLLGLGPVASSIVPSRVAPHTDMRWMDVAGGGRHVCAIREDHTAWCWGIADGGHLGDGTSAYGSFRSEPTAVLGGHRFTRIEVGAGFSCALDEDQGLWCWGQNLLGQVGDGSRLERSAPVRVGDGRLRWRDVTAGWSHACGLTDDDRLFCWGRNNEGQVGLSPRDFRMPGVITLP